jgi:hypothetical protein
VVAALIGDRSSAPIDFVEGGGTTSGAQSGLKASTEGGEALMRPGVGRGGRVWKRNRRGGGGVRRPLKWQATSGSGTWRREIWGPGQRREA